MSLHDMMSWATTQLKYQLIRISEILLSWAKFAKSSHFEEIHNLHTDLLVEKWTLEDLEVVKRTYWGIVKDSGDTRLYQDLKSYFDSEEYSLDPTTMTSVS